MKKQAKTWVDYLLWILLAIGWFGVAKVSYENFTGTPCPQVLIVPVCYIVMIGYSLMVMSIIVWNSRCRYYFFVTGWALATAIALIGSVAEVVTGGGVCPVSGDNGGIRGSTGHGIPLCYVSLVLLLVIILLFVMGPYKQSRGIANLQGAREQ